MGILMLLMMTVIFGEYSYVTFIFTVLMIPLNIKYKHYISCNYNFRKWKLGER